MGGQERRGALRLELRGQSRRAVVLCCAQVSTLMVEVPLANSIALSMMYRRCACGAFPTRCGGTFRWECSFVVFRAAISAVHAALMQRGWSFFGSCSCRSAPTPFLCALRAVPWHFAEAQPLSSSGPLLEQCGLA